MRTMDGEEQQRLYDLNRRMKKWEEDDKVTDDDLAQVDIKTLVRASEMIDEAYLNEYDATKPGQGYADVDEATRTTSSGKPLADHEVTFAELLQKKYGELHEATRYPIYDPDDADGEVPNEKEPLLPTSRKPQASSNLMRIEDPEDLLVRTPQGKLQPVMLKPEFLTPSSVGDNNPSKFIRNHRMEQLSSVRNLATFLNGYRLSCKSASYTEKGIENRFCEQIHPRYVQGRHSVTRTRNSMIYVFFVEQPLFIACVFGRRYDLEPQPTQPGQDIDVQLRVYSYAGYRLLDGKE